MKRSPLKSKPANVSAWLRKSRLAGWLRKRGRKYNERRKEQYGVKSLWVSALPCLVCGGTPSDPHHDPPRSLGGTSKNLVPLCRVHHQIRHALGSQGAFFRRYGITLSSEAERIETEWRDAA